MYHDTANFERATAVRNFGNFMKLYWGGAVSDNTVSDLPKSEVEVLAAIELIGVAERRELVNLWNACLECYPRRCYNRGGSYVLNRPEFDPPPRKWRDGVGVAQRLVSQSRGGPVAAGKWDAWAKASRGAVREPKKMSIV